MAYECVVFTPHKAETLTTQVKEHNATRYANTGDAYGSNSVLELDGSEHNI